MVSKNNTGFTGAGHSGKHCDFLFWYSEGYMLPDYSGSARAQQYPPSGPRIFGPSLPFVLSFGFQSLKTSEYSIAENKIPFMTIFAAFCPIARLLSRQVCTFTVTSTQLCLNSRHLSCALLISSQGYEA